MKAPAFARMCTVFAKSDFLLVVCGHQAPSWIWKLGHPMQKLPRDAGDTAIGTAVLQILEQSTQGKIADNSAIDYTVPRFAGFRSWSAFERNSISLGVSSDGVEVTITPNRRDGRASFPVMDQQVQCAPQPDAVGAAILRASESCS